MGLFDDWGIRNDIRKLNNNKSDLCDDESNIRYYNGKIDNIIEDFQSFVKTGNKTVVNKLSEYKEPYQQNDGNLTNARTYIQREINILQRKLED